MSTPVTAEDLEARLAETAGGEPEAGLFGPDSVTWRVASRAALFAGAWRAAILQLAHPWVARAIAEHSDTERNPVGRFHRTFRIVFTFLFGERERVAGAARRLHRLHATITGATTDATAAFPAGTPYSANQREAMAWVLYTLWDTALLVHDELVAPLTTADKDAYVREGADFARLFGLDPRGLPGDFAALRAEMRRMMESGPVEVTPTARRLAGFLLRPPGLPLSRLWSGPVTAVTARWMPPELRAPFGFAGDGGRAARFWIGVGRMGLRLLPEALAGVPPYHEARRRIRGETESPAWLRTLSRRWLGCDRLVIGPISRGP